MYEWLQRVWYGGARGGVLLVPLGWLFRGLVALRRALYRVRLLPSYAVGRPVIVVGNITVGGTGKTPLTLHLAALLRGLGMRVGVASRGYGGSSRTPRLVQPDDDPALVGDEPLLIAQRRDATVAVGADRVEVARLLVEQGCDVVIADDGLQHLRLRRDVEIAVVDADRSLGNGRLLPAGPLREPAARLQTVDAVVINGGAPRGAEVGMRLVALDAVPVAGGRPRPLGEFAGQRVHAIAAIGNPARFFALLREHGLVPIEHALPDHAVPAATDLRFDDDLPVLMTEKDAVKCRRLADQRHWAVRVAATIREADAARLQTLLLRGIGRGDQSGRGVAGSDGVVSGG